MDSKKVDKKCAKEKLCLMTKTVKKVWKWICFNSKFVGVVALFMLIFAASVLVEIYGEINVGADTLNSFGVFCQVITSLMGCITSIIAISFSLQDSDFFGIKTKDLNAMRVRAHFDSCSCVIISIFFIALNAFFYLTECIALCLGISAVSIFFCIYITATEVPLMVKSEKTGIKILKENFLYGENVKGFSSEKFNDALKYLITEKNLRTTYERLMFGSKQHSKHNKDILVKLLDLQTCVANELKYITDKEKNLKTSNVLQNNLQDLLWFSFDIKTVADEPYGDYVHYITRTIYGLYNNDVSKEKTLEFVARIVNSLNYTTYDDEKKKFIFTVIFTMVTSTVKKDNFDFAIAIKKHYSNYPYFLNSENMSSVLFSLLSLFFFYLCKKSTTVPKSIQTKATEFINSYGGELGEWRTGYKSWKMLYRRHVEEFNIDLGILYRAFASNENVIEYWLYGESQRVIVDETFFMGWYLSNLYLSYKRYEHEYSALLEKAKMNDVDYCFLYACEKFLDYDGNYVISTDMQELANLYECGDLLDGVVNYENGSCDLYEFVNTVKKDELITRVEKCKKIDNNDLSTKYKETIEQTIKNEWGYDEKIKEFSETEQLRIYFEKDEEMLGFDEVIANYLQNSIFRIIRHSIDITTIYRDENFETALLRLADMDIKYISRNMNNIVKRHIADDEKKEKILDKFARAKEIRGRILGNELLILSEKFSFNCVVDKLNIRNMNETEFDEKINEYKREDGQYTYRGVFLTRQELERIIYEKHVILTLDIRYATNVDKNKNYVIKLWKKN